MREMPSVCWLATAMSTQDSPEKKKKKKRTKKKK
ncbi:rCG48879 [Rattus norvegicus]|uniref:RCG48879 n=1 Tax=Rattus norvegicus TaxID=10116 RepID=A6IGR7_RAT|nr:rCG48879 [Rattus norvegicus]